MIEINTFHVLKDLISPFDESLVVINEKGKVLFATSHADNIFQTTSLKGQSFFDFISEEKATFKSWLQNISANESGEFWFTIKGSQYMPMRMHCFSWFDSTEGNIILLSIKDDLEIQRTRRDIIRKTLAIEHFSKSRKIRDGKLDEAIYEILEMSSKATETKRVNVWMLDEEKTRIDCIGSYNDSELRVESLKSLPRIKVPGYFKLFETEKIIVCNDLRNSILTEELKSSYLLPNNIQAMMDVPIRIEGDIIGVICFENVGKEREWTLQDQKFGLISAQMVSLALETYERKKFKSRLEAALEEQQNLFRETNHRVKNNLAIISSLIRLQEQYCVDDFHKDLFSDLGNRVASIASLHELLYVLGSFEKIDFREYLNEIIIKLKSSLNLKNKKIRIQQRVDELELDISRSIYLGLIVNELITNSYKHAFRNRADGLIEIDMANKNAVVQLSISDNGNGFDFSHKAETLGMEIVEGLVEQLDGSIQYDNTTGTSFVVTFKL